MRCLAVELLFFLDLFLRLRLLGFLLDPRLLDFFLRLSPSYCLFCSSCASLARAAERAVMIVHRAARPASRGSGRHSRGVSGGVRRSFPWRGCGGQRRLPALFSVGGRVQLDRLVLVAAPGDAALVRRAVVWRAVVATAASLVSPPPGGGQHLPPRAYGLTPRYLPSVAHGLVSHGLVSPPSISAAAALRGERWSSSTSRSSSMPSHSRSSSSAVKAASVGGEISSSTASSLSAAPSAAPSPSVEKQSFSRATAR